MSCKYVYYKRSLVWDGDPSLEKKLNQKEAGILLKENNALFLRNLYDFDCQNRTSFWYVIKDTFGGMEELSSRTRNKIRRANNLLEIRIIDSSVMAREGYDVYLSAFKGYSKVTDTAVSKPDFISGIQENCETDHYWGCFDKESNRLIAYTHVIIQDGFCFYSSLKADSKFLTGYYPFYGLIYKMNEYYLENAKMKCVTDGARSITEHSNIQSFLIDFLGFRQAYCNIAIFYVWWFAIIIKVLFPFRTLISNLKVRSILKQEAWARGVE